jgi:hypothetical protein
MSGIEATTTDGGTTGTSQTRNDASSAAERLGGPVEDEPRHDTARRAEPGTDRQTDAGAREGEWGTDTARQAEADTDRHADTTAGEAEQGADTARRAETDTDRDGDTDANKRTALIEPESAEGYNRRWNELKSEFVDEPRSAVRGANELVGEVLDELEELFRRQRADLEHGLDSEETTTEDLRQALRRYRSFFDRLLTF